MQLYDVKLSDIEPKPDASSALCFEVQGRVFTEWSECYFQWDGAGRFPQLTFLLQKLIQVGTCDLEDFREQLQHNQPFTVIVDYVPTTFRFFMTLSSAQRSASLVAADLAAYRLRQLGKDGQVDFLKDELSRVAALRGELETQLMGAMHKITSLEEEVERGKEDVIAEQQRSALLERRLTELSGKVAEVASSVTHPFDLHLPFQLHPSQHYLIYSDKGINTNPDIDSSYFTAVPKETALWAYVEGLFRTRGALWPSPSPVSGFRLAGIDMIRQTQVRESSFVRRGETLEILRQRNGTLFRPNSVVTPPFSAEQLQVLINLRDFFLPRGDTVGPFVPDHLYVFQGTRLSDLSQVVRELPAGLISSGCNPYGEGVYTTVNIELAAKTARGDFDLPAAERRPGRPCDGAWPIVMGCAAIGLCYPVTVCHDGEAGNMDLAVSGKLLKSGFDSHAVAVSQKTKFRACVASELQYLHVVFEKQSQVIPMMILWVTQ